RGPIGQTRGPSAPPGPSMGPIGAGGWRAKRPPASPACGTPSILGEREAHFAVALRIVAPTLAHLDVEEEVHRLLQDAGELLAGLHAELAHHARAAADHDRLLALALHEDGLLDAHGAFPLHPRRRLHRDLVGQLVVQAGEYLLARDLRRQKAQRRVRDLVGRIVPRTG